MAASAETDALSTAAPVFIAGLAHVKHDNTAISVNERRFVRTGAAIRHQEMLSDTFSV